MRETEEAASGRRLHVHDRIWVSPALVFLIALLLYGCSLDSDVGFWDTAEMNTVPFILGLAHPTGFPSEIVLGWLFSHIWLPGEVSYRLSFLNAIEVAAAAAIAFMAVLRENTRFASGLFSAALFATAAFVWQHATHTDVFSLCVALVAATIYLVRRWWTTNEPKYLLWAALPAGVALGTHGAASLYLLVPAALCLTRGLRDRNFLGTCATALGAAVVTGIVIYAYMPLRASYVIAAKLDPTLALGLPPGRPFWDWGDPRSLTNIISVVSGTQISATHAFGSFLSVAALLTSFSFAARELSTAVGVPILLIAAAFSIAGFFRDWRFGIFLLAPTLVISPFIASFSAESDPLRYYIVPFWGICILAALGFDRILSLLQRRVRWANAFAVAAVVLLAGHNVFAERALFMQRSDRLGFNYIDNVLAATSDGSVVVAPWTYATPIAYAAYVQGRLASRVLVAGDAVDFQGYLPKWFENHRIFVVSEDRPNVPVATARYVRNFFITPGSPHDAKLYELIPLQSAHH
jgi:Protein of unknown function (DUF2723)